MENNYEDVAKKIKNYLEENNLGNFEKSEVEEKYITFQKMFSPEILAKLEGKDVRDKIFLHDGDETTLCRILEYSQEYGDFSGGIWGGSAFKYSLHKSDEGNWIKGTADSNKKIIGESESIEIAVNIRDAIVEGANYIKNSSLNSIDDYYNLGRKLSEIFENIPVKPNHVWIHKYYSLIFPEVFPICHKDEMKKNMIKKLHLEPQEDYFANDGQLYLLSKKAGIKFYSLFDEDIVGLFYKWDNDMWRDDFDKHNLIGVDNAKYWVISSGPEGNRWNLFSEKKVISIGWDYVGNLENYENTKEDKKKLNEIIKNTEGKNSTPGKTLLKFSKEIKKGDYVFAKEGNTKIRGFGKIVSDYFYDKNIDNKIDGDLYSHFRRVVWFEEGEWNLLKQFKGNFTLKELEGKELNDILGQFDVKGKELNMKSNLERNKIYFGAPGTGKSFKLRQDKEKLFIDNDGEEERVTFHPDYSYANFVGTYKPVPLRDEKGNLIKNDEGTPISYEYVPGPFIRMLVKAFRNPENNYLLIIEEINRANVAAVFGDIFQLLDRLTDEDENTGRPLGASEYDIQTSEDLKYYLKDNLDDKDNALKKFNYGKIWIPENLYLHATMNSADQGVFPMDSAFKRRWDFEYIGINNNEDELDNVEYTLGQGDKQVNVTWNDLRKAINNELIENVNEDKLLGPFFIPKNLDQKSFEKIFENKVLMYLFEDVAKARRNELFEIGDSNNVLYSKICKDFRTKGIYVFCENIRNKILGVKDG